MHTNRDSKSNRENGSDASDMVTREKRAPKLRGDGGMKPTKIDVIIELYAVTLQRQEICGGRLIKVNLLNEGLQATKLGLKKEIVLLESEKSLKDLCLIGIHCFKGLLKIARRLDARDSPMMCSML